MILVDTSVWIDFFNGIMNPTTDILDNLLSKELLLIGDLIYCEVLQGFKNQNQFDAVLYLLSNLQKVELCGFDISLEAALNYRILRKKGITVRKTIDMIIATFCIKNNHRLLHNDKDFNQLEKYLSLKIVK